MRSTILTSITATAILIVFVFVSVHVHDQRERKKSDALYFVARQAYERETALKNGDESQFYPEYMKAKAAYEALNDFDISHSVDRWSDIVRRDGNLEDCVTYPVILRSPTSSQAIKKQMKQSIQKCATDLNLKIPTDTK